MSPAHVSLRLNMLPRATKAAQPPHGLDKKHTHVESGLSAESSFLENEWRNAVFLLPTTIPSRIPSDMFPDQEYNHLQL